jgi:hypothetical protein
MSNLTQEDLERVVVAAKNISVLELDRLAAQVGDITFVGVPIKLLIAELHRLRSDDWLRAAARAIDHGLDLEQVGYDPGPGQEFLVGESAVLAILRKHRNE